MALTQMQLIQSLGEAMAWFEKERSWGVPPQELRHLCGRIGELFAAMITNGQMANNINQKGYDVVSGIGERISVKTTTMSNPLPPATANKEYSGRFVLRVDKELHREVAIRVQRAGESLNTYCQKILKKATE